MAAVGSVASPSRFLPLPSRPQPTPRTSPSLSNSNPFPPPSFSTRSHVPPAPLWRSERARRDRAVAASVTAAEDLDVIPVQSPDATDQQDGVVAVAAGREQEEEDGGGSSSHGQVGGFAFDSGGVGSVTGGGGGGGGGGDFSSSPSSSSLEEGEDVDRFADRAINAAIVLAVGTFAITKLLTIDRDYWHVYHA